VIEMRAPAKVNLYLHVTGRRPDGYHLLDSLVGFVDAADVLTMAPSSTYRLTIGGPFAHQLVDATACRDNLVTRAAEMLARHLGRAPSASIHLVKNLPIAAGIGGGSADAAAALIGLCRLWGHEVGWSDLSQLARRIGQDVPACLASAPARFVGIGDMVEPVRALPDAGIVLANPAYPLVTPHVFGEFRSRGMAFSVPQPFEGTETVEALADALATRRNDLEAVACDLVPAIREVLGALTGCEGCLLARMSGSGPTCFGLFPSAKHARVAAQRLACAHAQWWVTASTWYAGRPA
jgi:4-diphosphocytidyl-2-C-methyl-D-erythritol kinase